MDYAAAAEYTTSHPLLCIELSYHLFWNCAVKPLQTTDHPNRSVSAGSRRHHKGSYARIKIGFDVTCLVITACMTFFCLGHIMGLGIGTIVAAFTMGKGIAIIGNWMDQRVEFVSLLS